MALGTVSFQANDRTDVFYVAQVMETGTEESDESLMGIEDAQFDSNKPWVTGNVPVFKRVHVEGDTVSIQGWFKGEDFDMPFEITVYIECELAEELVAVKDSAENSNEKESNEPTHVFL